MLSVQEMSDRFEIEQLMTDYCTAVDSRDFDALTGLFTPDAVIDYSAVGGARGTVGEIVGWLRENLALFSDYFHLVGNHSVHLDGDTATATSLCLNPMVFADHSAKRQMMLVGVRYHDELARIDGRWMFTSRHEEKCFMHMA